MRAAAGRGGPPCGEPVKAESLWLLSGAQLEAAGSGSHTSLQPSVRQPSPPRSRAPAGSGGCCRVSVLSAAGSASPLPQRSPGVPCLLLHKVAWPLCAASLEELCKEWSRKALGSVSHVWVRLGGFLGPPVLSGGLWVLKLARKSVQIQMFLFD